MTTPAHVAATLDTLSLDPSSLAGPDRVVLVGDLQQVRSWIDAREAALLTTMHRERDDIDAGARDVVQLTQRVANVPFGEAKRRATRSTWLEELPPIGAALSAGRIGTVHADQLAALAERLPPEHRPALRASVDRLIDDVAALTPARARRHLADFEASLDSDPDARLERQRRNARLRLTKNADHTVGIHGDLDPVAGARLRAAVDAKVAELWRVEGGGRADAVVPTKVLTSEAWRARALTELVLAGANADPSTAGRAQILVLVDHQTLLGQLGTGGISTLADGTPIPAAEARRLACGAQIIPIVMGGPSRPLDVGRAARLATPAQRAALRTTHDSCCVDGCDVPFDYCEIHHLDWWRLGGPTDLDNLVPVCSKHHHLVHDHRWDLEIDGHGTGHLVRRSTARPRQTLERVRTGASGSGSSPPPPVPDPSEAVRRPMGRTRPTATARVRPAPAATAVPVEQVRPMRC